MKGPHKAVRPSPDGFGTGTTNPVNEKTSQSNTSYARGFIVWSDCTLKPNIKISINLFRYWR